MARSNIMSVSMSNIDRESVFVQKVNPDLALGRWMAVCCGMYAYSDDRNQAINEAKFAASEAYIPELDGDIPLDDDEYI